MLVDDHEIVRHGVRAFLEAQPDLEVVGEANSGTEALRVVTELVPDVLLLDLLMPGMSGVEVTTHVKRISPHTAVVVLTSYHEDEYIFPVLRAGALSYVLKDIRPDGLIDAARKAARGEATLHGEVAARLVQEFRAMRTPVPQPFTELSERELDVLRLIARGGSNAAIAQDLVISEQTVKRHVSNVLSKLQMTDRTQAAVFAWQQGLVSRD